MPVARAGASDAVAWSASTARRRPRRCAGRGRAAADASTRFGHRRSSVPRPSSLRQPVFVRTIPCAPAPIGSIGCGRRTRPAVPIGGPEQRLRPADPGVPRLGRAWRPPAWPSPRPPRRPHPGPRRERMPLGRRRKSPSTWSMASRRNGSPMPTRSRANLCVSSSPTIDRRPLWPPALPSSRRRSRPSGSAKSSSDDSRSRSGACSRARTLADRAARQVHVRGRLHEHQLQVADPAARTTGGAIASSRPPGPPARSARRSSDHPADVVARALVARPWVPEPDDHLVHDGLRARRRAATHDVGAADP